MILGYAKWLCGVLEIDRMREGITSLTKKEHPPLAVDKRFISPFASPLLTKQAEGLGRQLLQLYLTFGAPEVMRYDGGNKFGETVIQISSRYRSLAVIQLGFHADHPRVQRTVERLGGWT